MIKKNHGILLLTFSLIWCFIGLSAASSADDEMNPKELLRIADSEIFLRKGPDFSYPADKGVINEKLEGNILHQYWISGFRYTDVLTSMIPSVKQAQTTNQWMRFDQFWGREFHAVFYVQKVENMPKESGGTCWLGYTNILQRGEKYQSGVLLYPGSNAYWYTIENGERVMEPIADLSSLKLSRNIRFDFIRLDGTLFVYANQKFLFRYEDGITDNVSFSAGSELFENGNRVRCEVHDVSILYR